MSSNEAVRLIENWEPDKPQDSQFIWRYINFTQLISILENHSLWFSRVDQFGDPYEGTLPEKVEKAFLENYTPSNEENLNRESQAILLGMGSFRFITYANCWHKSDHESAAMWELYRDVGKETAIRTTVGRLEKSIEDEEPDLHVGDVRYVDYDEIEDFPILQGYAPAFHKRISFDHEQEFRAVFLDTSQMPLGDLTEVVQRAPEETDPGKPISVNPNLLIESIWVSPTAPKWLENLLDEIINTYEIDVSIQPSEIDRSPDTVLNQTIDDLK